jgi:hypothetical protein
LSVTIKRFNEGFGAAAGSRGTGIGDCAGFEIFRTFVVRDNTANEAM